MIILRNKTQLKLFSRTTPFPDKLRKDYEFNDVLADSCDEVVIDVQSTNEYNTQFNKLLETERDVVRKFRYDLKDDPNTWFSDAPGDIDVNTHYLGDSSKPNAFKREVILPEACMRI